MRRKAHRCVSWVVGVIPLWVEGGKVVIPPHNGVTEDCLAEGRRWDGGGHKIACYKDCLLELAVTHGTHYFASGIRITIKFDNEGGAQENIDNPGFLQLSDRLALMNKLSTAARIGFILLNRGHRKRRTSFTASIWACHPQSKGKEEEGSNLLGSGRSSEDNYVDDVEPPAREAWDQKYRPLHSGRVEE